MNNEPMYHDELEQFDPYFMERWAQEQEEQIMWYPCETCGESPDLLCEWSGTKQTWVCCKCGQPVQLVEEDDLP